MARYTLELGGKSAAMVLVAQRAGTVGYEILAVAKIEPLATLGITQAFVTTPA